MGTRREEIGRLLRARPHSPLELARQVKAPVKTVLADLEHVRRGLRPGEAWVVDAAACRSCGFVFRERSRLSTPSRCPECRSEDIADPSFAISAASAGKEALRSMEEPEGRDG